MENSLQSKRPFGFYVCSLAFTMERFAFYSAKWLIAVFIVHSVVGGGLGLTAVEGAKASANLVAFTYLLPLFGSFISDRWIGARYLVPVGMLFMAAGYLVGWKATNLTSVYIMIALVSIGTALFKPQTNAITGRLFKNKEDLDGAFSTQYSFVNIGSFIGTTAIGIIAAAQGYRFSFLICAIVMVVNAFFFIFGWRFLGEAGKRPFNINENAETNEKAKEADKTPLTIIEKKRVLTIVLISVFSIVFWLFWYLAYMPVYYHWANEATPAANWMIGNFQIPSSWFDSLNGLMCIALGPILGAYWVKKAKSPKGDWSMFQKTAIGLFLLGISYIVFSLADITRGTGQASILWIIAFGMLLSLGEMMFSPLGNSFITKFAPPKLLSLMMAVWIFSIFIAGKSYGYLYEITLKYHFATVYFIIAAIAIASGTIVWALNGRLNALVIKHEDK